MRWLRVVRKKVDDEYERKSVASIFLTIEPLTGKRYVTIREDRDRKEWAEFIEKIIFSYYENATKIVLVMDNLNTHDIVSLYASFRPEKAHDVKERIELHFTPKHGSWVNVAEIGLSVLKSQCLNERVDSLEIKRSKQSAWVDATNTCTKKIDWQFTTEDARIKQKRLNPFFIKNQMLQGTRTILEFVPPFIRKRCKVRYLMMDPYWHNMSQSGTEDKGLIEKLCVVDNEPLTTIKRTGKRPMLFGLYGIRRRTGA